MTRRDCISNRNIKIIAAYIHSKAGKYSSLFEGLPYPADEFTSPQDFFLSEDEWTTYENFRELFRRAKALIPEPQFYFDCGASSAELRSWGRFHYFVRVFATPDDGFRRLPFFNKNFNDTKEMEIILPPTDIPGSKRIRTLIKVVFHSDFDANKDYVGDPFLRGILSSIPTLWGLAPAMIHEPLKPYDPVVLLNQEPEFISYRLDARMEGHVMTLRDPRLGHRRIVGEDILLEEEVVNGKRIYLGKHTKVSAPGARSGGDRVKALLITQTVRADHDTLIKAGEIYRAPYAILDISYDRLSFSRRLSQIFRIRERTNDSGSALIETIEGLRKSIKAKNEAYLLLERTHARLREAKTRLDNYAVELEQKVEERTRELQRAKDDLLKLNRDLESRVRHQVGQLAKYNELRRYLSPKLTEKILSTGHRFARHPQRRPVTVVFTDIRGFSSLTDSLEPEELFHLLDRYLAEMIRIVHLHDGTLNKIIGDGLLIFFGDPIPMADHAARAVKMAIHMQKQVTHLRGEWLQYGHDLGIGIGINTGYATIGSVGSTMYRDYTVIGNQVNVAARLESLAGAGQILISQRTYSKVRDLVKAEKAGEITVKGIHTPVKTYRIQ